MQVDGLQGTLHGRQATAGSFRKEVGRSNETQAIPDYHFMGKKQQGITPGVDIRRVSGSITNLFV